MKVAILCGGKGLRYNNNDKPKGLAMIGNEPIIQHVMNIYSLQGHNDFILILGYKSELIKKYFDSTEHKYNITYEYICENMNTGGALQVIKPHIKPLNRFLCTYCDSLANVNVSKLISKHNNSNNIATLTAVRTNHIYGILKLSRFTGKIQDFEEKPKMREWINGGFFVFNYDIFEYIINDTDILETDVFSRLLSSNQIGAYKHNGFWDTINTLKDEHRLNELNIENTLPEWYNINDS